MCVCVSVCERCTVQCVCVSGAQCGVCEAVVPAGPPLTHKVTDDFQPGRAAGRAAAQTRGEQQHRRQEKRFTAHKATAPVAGERSLTDPSPSPSPVSSYGRCLHWDGDQTMKQVEEVVLGFFCVFGCWAQANPPIIALNKPGKRVISGDFR